MIASGSATSRVLFAALALLVGGCCRLGADEPIEERVSSATLSAASAPSPTPLASPAPPPPGPVPTAPPSPPPTREIAGAAHVLVAYKGAQLAPKAVVRTRDKAQARAGEAHRLLENKTASFEDIVKKYSDDPISRSVGGAIGNFERSAMPEAFSTATFNLAVGEISKVVETPRGFHIIRRTK